MTEAAAEPQVVHTRRAAEIRGPRAGVSVIPVGLTIPCALAALGLALRIYQIGHEPLWLDEAYTLLFSHLPFGRLITVGGAHEHPPLYYSLVHLALQIHDSYLTPRLISAVSGSLAIAALYALGWRIYGRFGAVVAALLLVVSPFHVWYSQDGRGYELAGLFVICSYLLLFEALERPRRRTWILYAVSLALCVYGEYTTFLALLPQCLLFVRARAWGLARPLLFAWAAAFLAFVPWLGMLSLDAAGIAADYWIPVPSATAVAGTAMEFLGFLTPCPSPPCSGTEVGIPFLAGHEVVLAGGLVLVLGLVLAWSVRVRDLTTASLVLWAIVPFVVVLALAVRRSLYLDRVFLDATFPLYLLIGRAASLTPHRRRSTRAVGVAVSLVLLGAGAANLAPVYAGGVNPDWKSVAKDLAAAYQPGESIIYNPGVLQTLLGAYLPASWHPTFERPVWSRAYVDVPGWQERFHTNLTASKQERVQDEAHLRDIQFMQAARGRRQVWLVTFDYSGMNDSRRWMSDHGFQNVLSVLYRGDTRLELWDRSAPAAFGPAVVADNSFRSWHRTGNVRLVGNTALTSGSSDISRSFDLVPDLAYSASVDFRGIPPASKPLVTVQVYDRAGGSLGTYPRTQWYDWPVNGVWLSQPFGFVAPPGAAVGVMHLRMGWGRGAWKHVAVYEARGAGARAD